MELVAPGTVRFPNAAEVRDYRIADHFDEKEGLFLDRFAQFAAVAAREAVLDAGVEWTDSLREQTAIVTGSSTGGQTSEDESFRDYYERKQTHPSRFQGHGQRRSQPHLVRARRYRARLYPLDRLFVRKPRHRPSVLDEVRNGTAELAIGGGSEAPFRRAF